MYPNNTKAFFNLKNVFVKNVIQADSFLKIFIKTKPSEQTYPCYGCKTKRVFLPSYHRRTRRLAFCVIYFLRQTFFLKQVSILTGVSVPTICRLLDTIHYLPPNKLPEAASTWKYQCIPVDPKKHRILEILPDRTQSHMADYWRNIGKAESKVLCL